MRGSRRVPGAFARSSIVADQDPTAAFEMPEIDRDSFFIPKRPDDVGGRLPLALSFSASRSATYAHNFCEHQQRFQISERACLVSSTINVQYDLKLCENITGFNSWRLSSLLVYGIGYTTIFCNSQQCDTTKYVEYVW